MTTARERAPRTHLPDADLAFCAQEPIQIPGAIQPHGALLAVRADSLLITHASANLQDILGQPAQTMLGRPLAVAVGEAASLVLQGIGQPGDPSARRTFSLRGPRGDSLQLEAYRSGSRICVDIEQFHPEPWQAPSVTMAQSILETFKQAKTPAELCDLAVRGLRDISGYDRVIVYRFHADGHGEVTAEACAPELDPYLGIHYPASDVPAQARMQYLRQPVGVIGDATYQPIPLLTHPDLDDTTPLDLTHSALRSVSPLHREYMRNMKTAASMTIGVSDGQSLWGMLVCHHGKARVAGPDLRAVAGMIGQVVSLLLASLGAADLYLRRNARQSILQALTERLTAPVSLTETLVASEGDLLRLVDAAGAMLSYAGSIHYLGRTPPQAAADRAFATLRLAAEDDVLAVDDLGLRYPTLAGCIADGSGALLLPLAQGTDDAILWFRPERSQTVDWGGNPAEHGTIEPITGRPSPRVSFAIWKETVRGLSAPWEDMDLGFARDLRKALDGQLALRLRTEIAQLRQLNRTAAQPVEQRMLELEEFSHAAWHDLRAPLRAIQHLADWIGEDLDPVMKPDAAENLRLLQGRVKRLQMLLDGLLTYSRVGRQTYTSVEDIDIAAMVHDIVADLEPPPGFTVTCQDGLPVIRTHRVAIELVLSNLIGNAIKHHDRPEGHVVVAMQRVNGVSEFRVSDDGPGIPPQFHDRVFVVFQTLVGRDEMEATGIGLAIVKKLVQAHGGTIHIQSLPPVRGSTFVFTWDQPQAQTAASASAIRTCSQTVMTETNTSDRAGWLSDLASSRAGHAAVMPPKALPVRHAWSASNADSASPRPGCPATPARHRPAKHMRMNRDIQAGIRTAQPNPALNDLRQRAGERIRLVAIPHVKRHVVHLHREWHAHQRA